MNGKSKKKLCWNCEGSTSFEDENCPYCGVYLSPLSISDSQGKDSLFAPPYRNQESDEPQDIPASPYLQQERSENPSRNKVEPEAKSQKPRLEKKREKSFSSSHHSVIPVFLLFSGAFFLLFSLALFLFARNGVLTLKWNSHFWFVYLLMSIILLFFGWRILDQLPEKE